MAARAKRNRRQQEASRGSRADAGGVRLQKLLAEAGVASRRGAERLLREGRISVNGRTAEVGDRADPARDEVAFDGEPIRAERNTYWMLNKPRGVLSSRKDPDGRPVVLDWLPELDARLYPVGRLDSDSEGLLLLTNDGQLADALLHPRYGSEREYLVTVKGNVQQKSFGRLERGIVLDDGRTAPAEVSQIEHEDDEITRFHLVLREGRKRQIRRSLAALGHPVKRLVRVRMGPIKLGRLARGEARPLSARERSMLTRYAEEKKLEVEAERGRERRRR